MLKVGTRVYVVDNTGVIFVKIFQAISSKFTKEVTIGDVVWVTVRVLNTSAHFLRDDKMKRKFRKGSVHKGIVVHVMEKYRRRDRSYIWFRRPAVVLVSPLTKMPYGGRVKGKNAIPKEVLFLFPAIASITRKIV